MKTQMIVMAALLAVMPLAGCASIFGGSTRKVQLTSQPAGAQVTIRNSSDETVFAGTTPAVAKLRPGAGYFRGANYTVTFTKSGYATQEHQIKRGINGWYIGGNFFFGGLIGWLVVDPLTGAMWTLERNCGAELTPLHSSSARDTKDLKIVCLDDVPNDLRTHLRRVN